MTSPFKKPSAGSGAFFKPDQHIADLALIIEPKSIRRDVPNEYQGIVTPRDEVTADITIFRNSANIDGQTPHEVIKGAVIVHKALANEAEKNMGEVLLCVVRKVKNYYAFQEVTNAEHEAAAGAYFANREGAVAEALADAPSFD